MKYMTLATGASLYPILGTLEGGKGKEMIGVTFAA